VCTQCEDLEQVEGIRYSALDDKSRKSSKAEKLSQIKRDGQHIPKTARLVKSGAFVKS
jgi:hypothetical protein